MRLQLGERKNIIKESAFRHMEFILLAHLIVKYTVCLKNFHESV